MKKSIDTKLAFVGMVDLSCGRYPPDYCFRVFVVNANGTGLRRVDQLEDAVYAIELRWSSDGKNLIYKIAGPETINEKSHSISVIDGSFAVVHEPVGVFNPLDGPWDSPDGKFVALVHEEDDKPGFVLSDTATQNEILCAERLFNIHNFNWLPDSSAVTFSSDSSDSVDPYDVWLYEVESGTICVLAKNAGCDYVQSWSPDLQNVVITQAKSDAPYGDQFFLVSRDGARRKHLVDQNESTGEVRPVKPSWSSDGEYFAISVMLDEEEGDFSLQVFMREGARITSSRWPDEHLAGIFDMAWQPAEFICREPS
jgi:Tol biopolymer transport system component